MKNNALYKYIAVMFIAFMMDGIITYFIPYDYSNHGWIVVSYVGLLVFIFMSRTLSKTQSILTAAITGLYYAVVYANSLFVYSLLYPLCLVVVSKYFKNREIDLLEYVVAGELFVAAVELIIYLLMTSTRSIKMTGMHFALYRLLPTMVFTLVLSLVVYFVVKHFELAKIRANNDMGQDQDEFELF